MDRKKRRRRLPPQKFDLRPPEGFGLIDPEAVRKRAEMRKRAAFRKSLERVTPRHEEAEELLSSLIKSKAWPPRSITHVTSSGILAALKEHGFEGTLNDVSNMLSSWGLVHEKSWERNWPIQKIKDGPREHRKKLNRQQKAAEHRQAKAEAEELRLRQEAEAEEERQRQEAEALRRQEEAEAEHQRKKAEALRRRREADEERRRQEEEAFWRRREAEENRQKQEAEKEARRARAAAAFMASERATLAAWAAATAPAARDTEELRQVLELRRQEAEELRRQREAEELRRLEYLAEQERLERTLPRRLGRAAGETADLATRCAKRTVALAVRCAIVALVLAVVTGISLAVLPWAMKGNQEFGKLTDRISAPSQVPEHGHFNA